LCNYGFVLILVIGINKFLLDLFYKFLPNAQAAGGADVTPVGPLAIIAIISCFLMAQVLGIASALGGGVALSTMGAGRWVASKITRSTKQVAGAAAGTAATGAKTVARSALAGYRKRGSVAKG
jgi:type IV secretion system protein VirB6